MSRPAGVTPHFFTVTEPCFHNVQALGRTAILRRLGKDMPICCCGVFLARQNSVPHFYYDSPQPTVYADLARHPDLWRASLRAAYFATAHNQQFTPIRQGHTDLLSLRIFSATELAVITPPQTLRQNPLP